MNEHSTEKRVRIHPAVTEEFRKITAKIDAVIDSSRSLSSGLKDEEAARNALERQRVQVGDLPGKKIPFKYQVNIPIAGGTDSLVTGTVNVARDGPFLCRRLYVSVLITDAPIVVEPGGTTNTYSYTDFIGRYCPASSRRAYAIWGSPDFYFSSPIGVGITPVPPPVDFEWRYNDSGSERDRQNRPISGDILARSDDDGFLMNNDVFAAGTTIRFTVVPTRELGIIEQSFRSFIGQVEVYEKIRTGVLDVEVQVTFDGFKVLQPLGE